MSKSSTVPIEQPATAADFHQEITEWRRQNALWCDELAIWHKEHDKALLELANLERTLHRFAEAEEDQREALAVHEQQLHAHQRAVAQYLQGDEALSLQALEQQHRTARAQQAARQEQHDQTKRLFHEMMSKVEVVRRAIDT